MPNDPIEWGLVILTVIFLAWIVAIAIGGVADLRRVWRRRRDHKDDLD